MISAGPHRVVAKDDVHAPVQTVLDTPMEADALIDALSVRWQAAEIQASLSRSLFSSDRPFGRDHCKRFQVWPTLGGVQTVKLVEDITTTHFDPAMIFLDDFVKLVGGLGWCGLEGAEEVVDRFGQLGLMSLTARRKSAPRSRMACAMFGCVPIASMVTMLPSSAKVASSSGMAVFSFDFSAVARCPSTQLAWAAKALTR